MKETVTYEEILNREDAPATKADIVELNAKLDQILRNMRLI